MQDWNGRIRVVQKGRNSQKQQWRRGCGKLEERGWEVGDWLRRWRREPGSRRWIFGGTPGRRGRRVSLKAEGRQVLWGPSEESKQGVILRSGGSDRREEGTGMRNQPQVGEGLGQGRSEGIRLGS